MTKIAQTYGMSFTSHISHDTVLRNSLAFSPHSSLMQCIQWYYSPKDFVILLDTKVCKDRTFSKLSECFWHRGWGTFYVLNFVVFEGNFGYLKKQLHLLDETIQTENHSLGVGDGEVASHQSCNMIFKYIMVELTIPFKLSAKQKAINHFPLAWLPELKQFWNAWTQAKLNTYKEAYCCVLS